MPALDALQTRLSCPGTRATVFSAAGKTAGFVNLLTPAIGHEHRMSITEPEVDGCLQQQGVPAFPKFGPFDFP